MTQTNAGKRRRLAAVPGCHTLLPMTEITGAEPGPSDRILTAPSEKYTRELIEAVPMIGKPFRLFEDPAESL